MKLLLWGPVLTASGYGEHARQVLRALLDSGQFDVSVQSVRWGQTPFLTDDEPFLNHVRDLCAKGDTERASGVQFDIAVQVTIPNEFKRMAKIHIGVTAGIEVDRVSPVWIEKANAECDLVVVPSQHSAQTYASVQYQNQQGGDVLRLQKPMMVVPEGFDPRIFRTAPAENTGLLDDMPAFNFLTVGLGMDKPFGQDRKNISGLVKAFCEEFKDDDRVGLVLKVSLMNASMLDFEAIKDRVLQTKRMAGCGDLPRIKVIHGRMSKDELARLYRDPKVGAYVSLTHGEGYGLPLLEAAASGLPVIATNWSGHLDFLKLADGKRRFIPVEFDLKEIPPSAVWDGVMDKGTRWAEAKDTDARAKMKKVFLSPEKPREWAAELATHLAATLDERDIGKKFVEQLVKSIPNESPKAEQKTPKQTVQEQLGLPEGKKSLLFTMPMSAGDIVASTGTVSALRKKFPHHFIIYATDPKFAELVKDNPDIDRIAGFEQWMMDVPFCEGIFDEVFTPNLAIQLTTSNWLRNGKGRKLADEMAAQCHVRFHEYRINVGDVSGLGLPPKFIAFHPGSGQGQHEARHYRYWRKVIHNIKKNLGDIPVVTVGQEGDIHFEGCVDLRGRTSYPQLAGVIQKAACLVGIDSVTMHMAAALETPHVAIFGSSYASSTGPVYPSEQAEMDSILIETRNKLGCEKACYKHQCKVDRDRPCLNEIDPKEITSSVVYLVDFGAGSDISMSRVIKKVEESWDDVRPKIAGYTHILNPEQQGFPYLESIRSMLGFCDEVVVVDGGSTDGSLEKLKNLDPRVKVLDRKWDWEEPGMDGMQKAFGRAMCSVGPEDFLWQQDADEVVSERDYDKIKKLAELFPVGCDLIHLPVVELWGGQTQFRTDRHSWKWRMSRNNFRITHGINKDARVIDQKTGRTYAKKNQSDGCEYIDVLTGEYIPHKGFYTQQLELLRKNNPEAYGKEMNRIFGDIPSVFHYSWADIPRKVRNFRDFWDKCWSNLYNDPKPEPRFPDVKTEGDVLRKAEELFFRGGEHGPAKVVGLGVLPPVSMIGWRQDDRGPLSDDKEPAQASLGDAAVPQGVDAAGAVQADGRP